MKKFRSYRSYNSYSSYSANNDYPRYDENSDDAYDSAKDSWVLGDEPMTASQRRENDSWDETCRQNGW